MEWQGRRESDNVEDRRSMGKAGLAIGGGGGAILLIIIYLFLGGDPSQLMEMQQQQQQQQQQVPTGKNDPAEEELVKFVKVILADTEDVWGDLFRKSGLGSYREPKLVLFRDHVDSACGFASAAVGPFYCPADQRVYLDLQFFDEMKRVYRAPGDFAQAYVIAHEVGHHVQNLVGTSNKVHALQQRTTKTEANRLSVRLELQADYLAGVWAHHIQKQRKVLEPGDIEEAIRAANAIGDDALQRKSRGYVVPDSFTHGTSEQRIRWFTRGFQTGDFAGREALFEIPYNQL